MARKRVNRGLEKTLIAEWEKWLREALKADEEKERIAD